jgi:hypothetical protein
MAARDIQFVIKAQDEATRAFESIASALQQLMTAQGSLQGSTDGVNTDLTALIETLGSFDKVASTVGASSDKAAAAFDKQTAKIAELNAELAAVAAQAKNADQALASVKSVGAATGQDAAAAAKIQAITAAQDQLTKSKTRLIAQIDREQATLKTLGAQYQRVASLANAVDQARPMVGGLLGPAGTGKNIEEEAIGLTKFGRPRRRTRGRSPRSSSSPAKQSRDNFSRMAGSATILLQALGLMKASFLIPFAGFAVVLGGVVVAMTQMADEAERLRKLNAILRENADGAELQREGDRGERRRTAGLPDCRDGRDGGGPDVHQERTQSGDFVAFGQAAKDSFKVDPSQFKDVKDAAKQIAEAFTGGYDAIVKLDEATNFLSRPSGSTSARCSTKAKASEARTTRVRGLPDEDVGLQPTT